MTVPDLAYVALAVRDVGAAADVLERAFRLPRRDASVPGGGAAPLFGVGRSSLALFAEDDPFLGGDVRPGVHHMAVAAADPESMAATLGMDGEQLRPGPGLDGSREVRLAADATRGVCTRICQPIEPLRGMGDPIERIDHIGVASADNRAATDFFAGRMGLPVESTQTDLEVQTATESFTSDKYGVVYQHRPPEIIGGLRVSFISVGDCELEFLQPFAPEDRGDPGDTLGFTPGNTRGDKSAIGRYIERHGEGLHHLALKTPDIDAALASFAERGLSVIDRVGRPGSRRARIGFIHPRSLSGVLVHLVERHEL